MKYIELIRLRTTGDYSDKIVQILCESLKKFGLIHHTIWTELY